MRRISPHLKGVGAKVGPSFCAYRGQNVRGFFGMHGRMRCECGSLLQPSHFRLVLIFVLSLLSLAPVGRASLSFEMGLVLCVHKNIRTLSTHVDYTDIE